MANLATFLAAFLAVLISHNSASKILVVPLDGSHWINMEVILKELHTRGHQLTVLHSPNSWYIPANSSLYTSITATMFEDGAKKEAYNQILLEVMEGRRSTGFFSGFSRRRSLTRMLTAGHKDLAQAVGAILDDSDFMDRLRRASFDLMLTDPGLTVGVLLGNYLGLPMVFNVRWINNGEAHFAVAPSPVSYVPVPGSELPDAMDFSARLQNVLHSIYSLIEFHFYISPAYSELLLRHFPPGTDLLSLEQEAAIWLVRSDFVFEFPRPSVPNVIHIAGFQCGEPRPLPAHLEAFLQSSGEQGVVLMTLGTLVSALPRHMTEDIAAAFAQLPQKVIWKFKGEKPSSLGDNTLLVDWLPQNDLLGHPKIRALVAHGGTNGLYEAIYHGVPVLGIPLLFDQFDNLVRLEVRGGARVLEPKSLTRDGFLKALRDVVETPSYRENMQRLSRLHRDRPTPPLETAVFWIEYVARRKGAEHLRPVGYRLPWFSYFCLDVLIVVVVAVVAVATAFVCFCKAICGRGLGKKSKCE
ncbi:UDP glucuronosyltransferase 5 family, polypeptide G1 isoform X1 [Stigmatopora nigra]